MSQADTIDADELDRQGVNQLLQKAGRYLDSGELEEAREIFVTLSPRDDDDTGFLHNMGQLALGLSEFIGAVHYYAKLTDTHPDNSRYLSELGRSLIHANMPQQGEETLLRAIEINPDSYEANKFLGMHLYHAVENIRALPYLEKAASLKPTDAELYAPLIKIQSSQDRYETALRYAKKLISLNPEAESYTLLARIHIQLGDMKEAERCLRKATDKDSSYGLAYFEMTYLRKFTEADIGQIRSIEKILDKDLSLRNRSSISFALGKFNDDIGHWDDAFKYYTQGNTLNKGPTQPDGHARYHKLIRKHISKKRLSTPAEIVNDSDRPVFIVGMPRSGTSLMEQIISSHPDADGVGELMQISNICTYTIPYEPEEKVDIEANLQADRLRPYAQAYLDVLNSKNDSAKRIVDKMPDNYQQIGLIHMLFPNATIIHARRDPLDTCLSCFFQPFMYVAWSFDLEWIGDQYRTYRNIMDYWNSVLPEGRVIDIHYEDIVTDPENQIRKLVTSTGLEWDPVCLEFQKNKRDVKTASMGQVRQKLYTSSKKRWHNYAEHLTPLANRIREYLSEEDVAFFKERGVKLDSPLKSKLSRLF